MIHDLHVALFFSLGTVTNFIAAENILSKLDLLRYDKVCLSSPDTGGSGVTRRMLGLCRDSPGYHYTRDKPPDHSALPGQTEKRNKMRNINTFSSDFEWSCCVAGQF